MRYINAWLNALKIPDLRKKILFTFAILVVFRLGSQIPIPGIDVVALEEATKGAMKGMFGLLNIFAGGALRRMSVFALGIMPFISASIIMQLLTVVIPRLERMVREGELGRRKINQYARYLTVFIAGLQGYGWTVWLTQGDMSRYNVVVLPRVPFTIIAILCWITGAVFLMWLGEQITDRGIGNGSSLLISWGIISRIPGGFVQLITGLKTGQFDIFRILLFVGLAVFVIASIIIMQQAQRRITVEYARRIVGRRVYARQATHIPLRVNTAGVMPIIFAASILIFPMQIFRSMAVRGGIWETLAVYFSYGSPLYLIIYAALVIFFTYFYTAVIFNPTQLAEDLRKYGGFIPGLRPGKPTADYIEDVLTKITLPGAFFLAFIALLPVVVSNLMHIPIYFGGTSVLIVVGVELDTLSQLEAQLMMRHYEGFLKRGRIRGRF